MHKLSPSDFAFLYEECKLCYCLKVKHGIYQPSMPMPGVFSAINTRLQTPLVRKNLRDLAKELPDAVVVNQEGWVESKKVPGTDVFIKGKYDLLAKAKDSTYVLVDLKISQPNVDKIDKYKYQLGAYKFALENPTRGKGIKISKMGLLIFYPDEVTFKDNKAVFSFPPSWLEVPADDKGLLNFLKEVDDLLSGPTPAEGRNCKWCKYRHLGEEMSHLELPVQDDLPF
jgi:CRISPR/Cas system-associated exonuclease Cas4 (RecB family)